MPCRTDDNENHSYYQVPFCAIRRLDNGDRSAKFSRLAIRQDAAPRNIDPRQPKTPATPQPLGKKKERHPDESRDPYRQPLVTLPYGVPTSVGMTVE
jgi:hypothetical protein